LEEYFSLQGYAVKMANNGQQLKTLLADFTPDIVLLDLNMPGDDGLTLTRYLREHTRAAIIMVTAASSQVDMIVGLEMGADDYVTKPFDLRALLARVKSVLRRTRPAQQEPAAMQVQVVAADPAADDKIKLGKCLFDPVMRKLWEGSDEVPLTSMEYDLLMVMIANPNRPLSREHLMTLTNTEIDAFDRSIDSRITRLRKKIEPQADKPGTIKTVRGLGYMFVPNR
jgi:two-component system phosphate regulon response regulator OmpR